MADSLSLISEIVSRCGGCTLCCTLLKIPQLNKPANTPCQHCTGSDCSIWGAHPVACRKFRCLWYANPSFPEALRPDLCGVLFEPGGDRIMLANCDLKRPDSWREGIGWAFIDKCLSEGVAVVVQVGATKHFLIPEGQTAPDIWRRITDDAKRRGYV